MTSIYDFKVTLENGEGYGLDRYKGKTLLIVNTATKCGLTPQFDGLETLYKKYQDQGLIILGFPSNQFKQELADGKAAAEACRMTYGVTFPMHELTVVNGKNADPLFKFLESGLPGTLGNAIKWNFTKFLIDSEGNLIKRFAPQTTPEKIIPEIEAVLA